MNIRYVTTTAICTVLLIGTALPMVKYGVKNWDSDIIAAAANEARFEKTKTDVTVFLNQIAQQMPSGFLSMDGGVEAIGVAAAVAMAWDVRRRYNAIPTKSSDSPSSSDSSSPADSSSSRPGAPSRFAWLKSSKLLVTEGLATLGVGEPSIGMAMKQLYSLVKLHNVAAALIANGDVFTYDAAELTYAAKILVHKIRSGESKGWFMRMASYLK